LDIRYKWKVEETKTKGIKKKEDKKRRKKSKKELKQSQINKK
jgi:hypothetical protein